MSTIVRLWGHTLQPPPPPPPAAPPPPPVAPLPSPGGMPPPAPPSYAPYGAPPPKKKSSPWGWIIGVGCLVILLAIGGAIYGGVKLWNTRVLPELQKARVTIPSATTTEEPPATETDEAVPKTAATPTAATPQPGKQAALKAALAGKGSWVGKINYAAPDWQRVKVWIGPPASEFTTAVVLQWDTRRNVYTVESKSKLAQFAPPAVDRKPATQGPHPSRQRALAKALTQAPESGWVAKASKNSGDWTKCTVMIGPPESEFVVEFDLEWNADTHKYAIRGQRNIGM